MGIYNNFSQNNDSLNIPSNNNTNINEINVTNISNENLINNEENHFMGKKHQRDDTNEYTYIPDKYVKKSRIISINYILNFINQLILLLTTLKKQLFPIDKKDLTHSSVGYDKKFLSKKLKEILSSISEKFTNVLKDENKDLIEDLINLQDKGKFFQELFELSFLDCLEHISGKNNIEILNGLPLLDEIVKNEKEKLNGFDIDKIKYCFRNYESVVTKKNSRNPKKPKKFKTIFCLIKKVSK